MYQKPSEYDATGCQCSAVYSSSSYRCGQCSLNAPSKFLDSLFGRAVWNPEPFAPGRQALRATAEMNGDVPPVVSRLLLRRGPNAIARFVIAVVVLALDGHSERCLAHVGEEVLKVQPAVTNLDAASAVLMKTGAVLVVASGLHRSPDAMRARIGLSMLHWALRASAAL